MRGVSLGLCALSVLALVATARRARAGDGDPRATVDPAPAKPLPPCDPCLKPDAGADSKAEETPKNRAFATTTRIFTADLDEDRGDVGIYRFAIDLEGQFEVRPRLGLTWGLGAESSRYRFSAPDRVVAGVGRLVEDAWLFRVSPGLVWTVDDDWRLSSSITVTASGVPSADPSDALSTSIYGAVRRRLSGEKGIEVGGYLTTSIAGSPTFVPILMVGGGETGPMRMEIRGPGVRAMFDLSDRFALGIAARYETRDFRLGPSDRVPDGVFRDVRLPVGIDLEWKPSPRVSLSGEFGWTVYNDLRLDDPHGHNLVDLHAEPAPWFGFQLTVNL